MGIYPVLDLEIHPEVESKRILWISATSLISCQKERLDNLRFGNIARMLCVRRKWDKPSCKSLVSPSWWCKPFCSKLFSPGLCSLLASWFKVFPTASFSSSMFIVDFSTAASCFRLSGLSLGFCCSCTAVSLASTIGSLAFLWACQ